MKEYRYITKHGLGPGTLPKDVELIRTEDVNDYITAIYLNRPLTSRELKYYDIYPEYIQTRESCKKKSIFESLTDDDIKKLSEYSLTEEELSHLLSLLELINDDDKPKAFEYVEALFKGKKLVKDEEKVEEFINQFKSTRKKTSESYTRKLLGDI